MRFSLGTTVSKVAAVIGVATRAATYVRNNLKIYFDFKSDRAKTLEFVGTGSVQFDGSTQYVNLGDDTSLNPTTAITISAWVYAETLDNYRYIVNRADDFNGAYRLEIGATVIYAAFGNGSANTSISKTHGMSVNKWHHVAVTYNSVIAEVYVDGVSKGTAAITRTMEQASHETHIANDNPAGGNHWDGRICQVGIWGRALSASEIANIMHKTYDDLKGTELTHLISWYPLDSSSNTYNDAHTTATVNDGTAVNTPVLKDDVYGGYSPRKPRGFDNAPTAQADLIGSGSALFDGSDDFVALPASNSLVTGTNVTFACWAKTTDTDRTYLIANQKGSGSTNLSLTIHANETTGAAGVISAVIWNGSAHGYVVYDGNIDDSAWHHYALTTSSSAQVLYLDGVLVATGTLTFGNAASSDLGGIGALNGANYFMGGNIAQVGIWSAVLTQEQIQSISQKTYSDLSSSEKTNLVSWWGLDVNANDEHGSNNGTLS